MEGYLHLKIAPWLRRLITRLIALIPAVLVIGLTGEESTQQLLAAQPGDFKPPVVIRRDPLIHFTSNRRNMGPFATPWWGQVLAWLTAAIIVGLNGRARAGPGHILGRVGGRIGPESRTATPELAGRSVARLDVGGRGHPALLGHDQAAGSPISRMVAIGERAPGLGRGVPLPAPRADRRGTRARARRRGDSQPGPQPRPVRS